MKHSVDLIEGKFIKRYKRFFADVQLNGEVVVCHVANTGSLKSVLWEGAPCLLSASDNPERKLKFSLQALKSQYADSWVGINTQFPNLLAQEAFRDQLFTEWKAYPDMKAEYKISAETRLDLMLSNRDKRRFVEVKNVSLYRDGKALFPDGVTERGQKHLRELIELVKSGHEAEILFVIQRTDVRSFGVAADIDPEYAKLLSEAKNSGVFIRAVTVEVTKSALEIKNKSLPVELD